MWSITTVIEEMIERSITGHYRQAPVYIANTSTHTVFSVLLHIGTLHHYTVHLHTQQIVRSSQTMPQIGAFIQTPSSFSSLALLHCVYCVQLGQYWHSDSVWCVQTLQYSFFSLFRLLVWVRPATEFCKQRNGCNNGCSSSSSSVGDSSKSQEVLYSRG